MIQRIAPSTSRIQGLTALLREPASAQDEARPGQGLAQTPVPDPAEILEAERMHVLQTARDEGYAQGMAEAEVEVRARAAEAERKAVDALDRERARLSEAADKLAALLKGLPTAVDELESRLAPVVIEAVFTSVTRLLGNMAADGTLIAKVSRQALDEYRQRPVVVRVSAAMEDLVPELDADSGVSVETDLRLAPGQCRLETHKGIYDAGLDIRLEELKAALLNAIPEGADR